MNRGHNPTFIVMDEAHSFVGIDFAMLEDRIFGMAMFDAPVIPQKKFFLDSSKDFHPTGRPKFKPTKPNKRAKVKAARKQRRQQK